MKCYLTSLKIGLNEINVLVLEYVFREDENYKGFIVPFYKNILSQLTFQIIKDNLILMKDKAPFLNIKLKNQMSFTELLVEIQLSVIDFAYEPVEQGCLKTILYVNKPAEDIIESGQTLFNIKGKDEKYLNFYKKVNL
jgi:hypothetical protein